MAAANIQRSGVHLIEALVLGTRNPASPLASTLSGWGQITATIPTAGAFSGTSVTATVTGVSVGDSMIVSGPTVALTHLAGVVGTVTATDTVTLVGIADSTGYTGASKVYNYVVFKGA